MEKQSVTLTVNGQKHEFLIGEKTGMVPPSETLVETLRKRLELTGAKQSCDEGACGCCTVIKDGDAIASCMILTVQCDGSEITTIEGLANGGTTVRNFIGASGREGHNQENLCVYGREGTPCTVCGREIIYTKVAGRGTRYCPQCQK